MKATLVALLFAACTHAAPVAPPSSSAPPPTPAPAVTTVSANLGPYTMAVPSTWTSKVLTSKMRAGDFIVAPDVELVIYYFDVQGAGSVSDNLDRWFSQFTQPDGRSTRDVAKIDHVTVFGQDAPLVSVSGHYAALGMGGSESVDKPDMGLLASIIQTPNGPYYFKLVGPKAAVEASEPAFRALLRSIAPAQ